MSGKTNPDRDVRVKIPLDPETALKALLAVDPDDEPADDGQDDSDKQEHG
jgi:hypothetical protein